MAEHDKITAYKDFWPYYLREHSNPRTRNIHFLGTGLAFFFILVTIATGKPWFLVLALVAGYAPAWYAHYFVEKNHPATFKYPLWSLFSDFRMTWEWLSGTLGNELSKAEIPPR